MCINYFSTKFCSHYVSREERLKSFDRSDLLTPAVAVLAKCHYKIHFPSTRDAHTALFTVTLCET